jgi:hypothetical protein
MSAEKKRGSEMKRDIAKGVRCDSALVYSAAQCCTLALKYRDATPASEAASANEKWHLKFEK